MVLLQVLLEGNMPGFVVAGAADLHVPDAVCPEVAVVAPQLAPGNEIPGITTVVNADRFYIPFCEFAVLGGTVLHLEHLLFSQSLLYVCQEAVGEFIFLGSTAPEYGYVLIQHFQEVFFTAAQHCPYFLHGAAELLPVGTVAEVLHQLFPG